MHRITVPDVEQELCQQFAKVQAAGHSYVDIKSGELHKDIGAKDRMPLVCHVMMKLKEARDQILSAPPSGQGATLCIRYALPR